MDYIYILGVKLHKIKKDDILKKIEEWLCSDKFHYITTVNPEFTLIAKKDNEFKEIINNSNLAVPDGIGLKFASWVFCKNIYRTTGADLTRDILKLAEQKNCSLYFFVWKYGLSSVDDVKKALDKYKKYYPSSLLKGEGGLKIEGQAIEKDGRDIDWGKFNNFKPDILLVGLGAPFQEKLIAKMGNGEIGDVNFISDVHGKILPTPPLKKGGDNVIKVAMGVGASFDFLCGKIKRAPKIMRFFGLEWLYRVLQPPKPPYKYHYRFKRIFNAVVVFPLEVVMWKIKNIYNSILKFYGNK